ncbi:alpha/beta fold hydrolase [Nostoc sp.]|uniref:alpha/beta fold hydrolase n=1 Tax=Nostoc sp. TaxID=1180 RepID=UPI002FFBA01C
MAIDNYIFPAEGAYPYQHDLKDVEFHLLDTGHFALEEDGSAIADHIRRFLTTHREHQANRLVTNSFGWETMSIKSNCHSTITTYKAVLLNQLI